jgi:hypothetical protein
MLTNIIMSLSTIETTILSFCIAALHFAVYSAVWRFYVVDNNEAYVGVYVRCPIFLYFNPLNAELNPICHLLALLGAHHILHVSRIRVKHTWILLTYK